jgi:hypothetical protein
MEEIDTVMQLSLKANYFKKPSMRLIKSPSLVLGYSNTSTDASVFVIDINDNLQPHETQEKDRRKRL